MTGFLDGRRWAPGKRRGGYSQSGRSATLTAIHRPDYPQRVGHDPGGGCPPRSKGERSRAVPATAEAAMRPFRLSCVAFVLTLGVPGLAPADDDARAVIQKAVNALGGE